MIPSNHTTTGLLAARYSHAHLPLEVLGSAMGYYIGTRGRDDIPVSRESLEFYRHYDDAQEAFEKGTWTQRTV